MPIENTIGSIKDLNPLWPLGTDRVRDGDDHVRNIKSALQKTFPNIDKPITASANKLNDMDAGIDISPTLVTVKKSLNVSGAINATGNISTGGNQLLTGSIEISATTPFIDFHLNNSSSDYTHRIEAVPGSLNLSPGISTGGSLAVATTAGIGGKLTAGGLESSGLTSTDTLSVRSASATAIQSNGGYHGPWAQYNIAPPYAATSSQGAYIGWNDGAQSGATIFRNHRGTGTGGFFFDFCGTNGVREHSAAFDGAANFRTDGNITISGGTGLTVSSGGIAANGNIGSNHNVTAGGNIIATASVYAGGAGGATMATDGNIRGGKWGGGWLDAWLQSDSSNLIRGAGGRLKGFDGVLDGGEVGQNRHTAQIRLDGQAFGMPIHSSDRRLKQDIKPIDAAPSLDKINAIEMVEFNWKEKRYTLEDGSEGVAPLAHVPVGFIAQQMQEHIPDAIYSCETDSPLQVNLLPLVSHLIGAVQTLTKRVQHLSAKVEALEAAKDA